MQWSDLVAVPGESPAARYRRVPPELRRRFSAVVAYYAEEVVHVELAVELHCEVADARRSAQAKYDAGTRE